jgi:hypothetical protein
MDIDMDESMGAWVRSSRCVGGDCVEVRVSLDGVAMRDSKDVDAGVLTFEAGAWSAFLADLRAGGFDAR